MNKNRVPGVVLAATFAMALASNGATYEWTFNNGNLNDAFAQGTMQAVGGTVPSFASTNGTTIPHIGGVPAQFLSVPAYTLPELGFDLSFDASGANGGGAYINRYSFVFDLYSPGLPNWQALFQTNPANPTGNDADWYIAPDGALGIGAAYTGAGAIQQETWYRIAFVTDLSAGRITYYINGGLAFQGSGGVLDGRFALFSNADAGTDVRLFNENDTSAVYTHDLYVNSIAFVDRELTETEVAGLGGPNAMGIFIPEPGTGFLVLAGLVGPLVRRRR